MNILDRLDAIHDGFYMAAAAIALLVILFGHHPRERS